MTNEPIEGLQATARLYLSGISGRRMNYAYFNIADDVIILSNSSTGRKGLAHGDRLTNHAVGELSFHIMKFKDGGQFIKSMKQLLHIPDGVWYGVHIPRLMALWNNFKLEQIKVSSDIEGKYIFMIPEGVKYDQLKHLVGLRIEDFHVLSQLFAWCNYAEQIGNEQHRNVYEHNSIDILPLIKRDDAAYRILLKSEDFLEPCKGLFANINMYSLMFDGLSMPSYKQFLSKVGVPYSLSSYFWTDDGSSIQAMYEYIDELVTVRSIRPNVRLIPLQLNIELDKNLLNP